MRVWLASLVFLGFFQIVNLTGQQLSLQIIPISTTSTSVTLEVLVSKSNAEPLKLVALSTVLGYNTSQLTPTSMTWIESSAFSSLNNPIITLLSSQNRIVVQQNPWSVYAVQAIPITNTPVSFGTLTIHSSTPINYPVTLSPISTSNPAVQAVVYHNGSTNSLGRSLATAPGGISLSPITIQEPARLNLTQTFIEGYLIPGSVPPAMTPVMLNSFNAGGVVPGNPTPTMSQCDFITVELRNAMAPHSLAFSQTVILNVDGSATIFYPNSAIGNSYYISVKSRNTVETWSANPVVFSNMTNYNFGLSGQAFGSNLGLVGSVPVIYSGDIDLDGEITPSDYSVWLLSNINGGVGYLTSDLDGDGETLPGDYSIWLSNNTAGVTVVTP